MSVKRVAPGQWNSPISAAMIATKSRRLSEPIPFKGGLYYLETIPSESARTSIIYYANGETVNLLPPPFSVRSRVYEYGGGAYTVHQDGLYFVNADDQRIFALDFRFGRITPLTSVNSLRYGDLVLDRTHRRLITVTENHDDSLEPELQISAIDLSSGAVDPIVTGADFYAAPTLSNDGQYLAWLEWSFPDMPWDHTRLMAGRIARNGELTDVALVAGQEPEALFQPAFALNDELHVVSDRRDGRWNLYRVDSRSRDTLKPALKQNGECGRPQFLLGMRTWAQLANGGYGAAITRNGLWAYEEYDRDGNFSASPLPTLTQIDQVRRGSTGTAIVGGGPNEPRGIWYRERHDCEFSCIRRSIELDIDSRFISRPEPFSFPTRDGEGAHALWYPPTNPYHTWNGAVPVRLRCHGGPTAAAETCLDPGVLYWTSRGFGVVQLNYRGSSGYGRDYREKLYGNWGLLDVSDAKDVIAYLITNGTAIPGQCVIAGSSAGGLTVLNALAGDTPFSAGCSYYGVADLEALMRDTHKFEAHYGDKLIGPLPDAALLFRERSPLTQAGRIKVPTLFFQGEDDAIVPPTQTRSIANILRDQGTPVAVYFFEGEGHGFRQPKTIEMTLSLEYAFYAQIFGWPLPKDTHSPKILNFAS